jgi:hypothetical protein
VRLIPFNLLCFTKPILCGIIPIMKIWFLLLIAVHCNAADLDRLIPALIKVESNGNNFAIGDRGNAVGCLQIWKIVIDDVNRILKEDKYTYTDRLSRKKSIEVCRIYLTHYAKDKTEEQAARIWNGGPRGHTKEATKKYWEKVRKEMR